MASRPETTRVFFWFAATMLAALLWWHGNGLHPVWWLTWLAPVPILWLAPRVRARWATLAAFLACAGGNASMWGYLHDYIQLPLPVIAQAIALPGVVFALCTLLYRRLLRRGRVFGATFAVAAAWVAVEYVASLYSPHGTFGSIAYTQMDNLPILQVAAMAGIWGVSFLVMLLPSAIAVQGRIRAPRSARAASAIAVGALMLAAIVFGSLRLQTPAADTLRVGLVSLNKPIQPKLDDAAGKALAASYATAIDKLADAGARVVVMPEVAFTASSPDIPVFTALAESRHVDIDTGIAYVGDPHAQRNMSVFFPVDGSAPITYDKHHLIPVLEDRYTPGTKYQILPGAPRMGLAICKDMDFHDIGRAYSARKAQLLLVPAWDFKVDGWLHSRMAIMRGVESGFAIARTARSGRLTLSDDRGRVVAEASSEQHDAMLVGNLALRHTRTLYARWGDWFAWLDLLLLASLLVLAFAPARTDTH